MILFLFFRRDIKLSRFPSDVNARFKAQEFNPLIRHRQFSLVELFSFVGGLLGLLVSAINRFEMISINLNLLGILGWLFCSHMC